MEKAEVERLFEQLDRIEKLLSNDQEQSSTKCSVCGLDYIWNSTLSFMCEKQNCPLI